MDASTTNSIASVPSLPRAVTFSEYSELFVFIPTNISGGDNHGTTSMAWYSSKETHSFHQCLVEDVRRVSHEIQSLPLGEVLSHEQMCMCLGAEMFVSGTGAAEYYERARRANIAAVLLEQRRQRHEGVFDMESLSNVSMKGSAWATKRARKLAMGYAAVLMG